MTLREAIKSGKPFKRTCNKDWIPEYGSYLFSAAEILANDWEIEEEKIEITADQLRRAINDADLNEPNFPRRLARLLGFKE